MNSLKKVTQKGFTIVELLIVIVVIGILAGLVITTYNGIQQNARNKERTTDLKAVQTQLEAYYANNVVYPDETQFGVDGSNNIAFIASDLKGLDKEALRDPKDTGTTDDDKYGLAATAPTTPGTYSYQAWQTGGTVECTAAAGDCAEYTLTAMPEGGGAAIVVRGQN